MTPQSNLDLSGDFRAYPFAELLVEIVQVKLTGSLRVSSESRKTVIYFREGSVVFGVSNSREFRLFHRLLKAKLVMQTDLGGFSGLANDMELAVWLQNKGVVSADDIAASFVSQIGEIVFDALTWPEGTWTFSPSARLRSDVFYKIEIHQLLLDYARCIPSDTVMQRFKSVQESFARQLDVPDLLLQPHEACVLEVFKNTPLSFEQIRGALNMPEAALAQALYSMWLGGLLVRVNWNKAFSESRIADIKTAHFAKIKDAAALIPVIAQASAGVLDPEPSAQKPVSVVPVVPQLSLDDWLSHVESAQTHYDILSVAENAPLDEIKNAYFGMAKLFHPDRYHRETGPRLRRIQVAFTDLAHAYETLKTPESRESYNYKIRKELEAREKRAAAGLTDTSGLQAEHALDNFENGLRLLSDDEPGAAAVHLARAVHYNPNNALYRAYYGVALSSDGTQLHKAESELHAAAKLEPRNSKIRLMLAQFFIDRKLRKRAEGELQRFLELAPDNLEARALLEGLQKHS